MKVHQYFVLSLSVLLGVGGLGASYAPTIDTAPSASTSGDNLHPDVAVATMGASISHQTFLVSMAGVAEEVAETGRLEFYETDPPLVLELYEYELFVPGQKMVIERAEDDSVLRETPYLGRAFHGRVEGEPASRVSMLIAPEGYYGVVELPYERYSFQPLVAPGADEAGIVQEVTKTELLLPFATLGAHTAHVAQVEPTLGAMTTYHLHIKAYAESAYASYTSDWSNRISSAYNYVANMFSTETSIYLGLYSIETTGTRNFASGSCSGVGDSGLADFTNNWINSRWDVDPSSNTVYANSYSIFTASTDPGKGVAGCGYNVHLTRNVAGGVDPQSTHAIMGKDWHRCNLLTACDSYEPDKTSHLGLAAGHELTHNAGEYEHWNDSRSSCDYNIMSNGINFACVNAWRTQTTINRVTSYAPARLT